MASSYSRFEESMGMKGLEVFSSAFPITPKGVAEGGSSDGSLTTPSGSSTDSYYGSSLFTPPSIDMHSPTEAMSVGTLQSLVQMALESSLNKGGDLPHPPPFSSREQEQEFTATAASLLSCLSSEGLLRPRPVKHHTPPCVPNKQQASPLRRNTSTTSSHSSSNVSLLTKRSQFLASPQVSTESSSSTNPMIQALVNLPPNQISVFHIEGKVMELATDRNGSRFLQKLLTQGGVDIVSKVIDEVEFSLMVIMCDTYANYMCQQLFQAASANQRTRLLARLVPQFLEVARDRRGTHSLQSLISHISTKDEHELLAQTFRGNVEMIALDIHATHVLQQAISCCLAAATSATTNESSQPTHVLDFVFKEVAQSVDKLAVDPNALGVVKRCITHSLGRGYATLLCDKIEEYLFLFVENPYANYAVQHALECWSINPNTVNLSERIISKLVDKVAPMALHKFASNVAEMAIKSATNCTRFSLIESLNYNDDSRMLSLMRSPFGVFVVGTAIKHSDPNLSQGQSLVMAISRNLKKLPDGRNKTKWEKLIFNEIVASDRE